jgi:hypothetical protein
MVRSHSGGFSPASAATRSRMAAVMHVSKLTAATSHALGPPYTRTPRHMDGHVHGQPTPYTNLPLAHIVYGISFEALGDGQNINLQNGVRSESSTPKGTQESTRDLPTLCMGMNAAGSLCNALISLATKCMLASCFESDPGFPAPLSRHNRPPATLEALPTGGCHLTGTGPKSAAGAQPHSLLQHIK